MKKLMIVLLFTVLSSTTVLSQSKNYGPLYSDGMYCMMSGWIDSKGDNKKSILLMNGVYEFQKGYEGSWNEEDFKGKVNESQIKEYGVWNQVMEGKIKENEINEGKEYFMGKLSKLKYRNKKKILRNWERG